MFTASVFTAEECIGERRCWRKKRNASFWRRGLGGREEGAECAASLSSDGRFDSSECVATAASSDPDAGSSAAASDARLDAERRSDLVGQLRGCTLIQFSEPLRFSVEAVLPSSDCFVSDERSVSSREDGRSFMPLPCAAPCVYSSRSSDVREPIQERACPSTDRERGKIFCRDDLVSSPSQIDDARLLLMLGSCPCSLTDMPGSDAWRPAGVSFRIGVLGSLSV